MAKISVFGSLTNIQMLLFTLLCGKRVGNDSVGNVYYRGKPRNITSGVARERRWVIYKNKPEASTVPPEWHGWLHHQTDAVPQASNANRKDWQLPPLANMTGTKEAYVPPPLKGQPRAHATGDYVAWKPTE